MILGYKHEDLTGLRFTRLTVVGFSHSAKHKRYWVCQCDCGNSLNVVTGGLTSGNTKSCGCLRRDNKAAMTHGMSKRKEYSHYSDVRKRCTNPNNQDYPYYSLLEHDPDIIGNFSEFFAEIGPLPDEHTKWSVGRIDNLKGYVKGNLEWQTDQQQAHNHCKQKNNTSGVTGVIQDKRSGAWYAQWNEVSGKKCQKWFSTKKYGDSAFDLACAYRQAQIERLNNEGAYYAETHGAERLQGNG